MMMNIDNMVRTIAEAIEAYNQDSVKPVLALDKIKNLVRELNNECYQQYLKAHNRINDYIIDPECRRYTLSEKDSLLTLKERMAIVTAKRYLKDSEQSAERIANYSSCLNELRFNVVAFSVGQYGIDKLAAGSFIFARYARKFQSVSKATIGRLLESACKALGIDTSANKVMVFDIGYITDHFRQYRGFNDSALMDSNRFERLLATTYWRIATKGQYNVTDKEGDRINARRLKNAEKQEAKATK